MKKLLSMLVCLAGLLVCVSSAHADVYHFNAVAANPSTVPPVMPGDFNYASGLWNVTLTSINGNTWQVDVIADAMSNPNGNADVINISFGNPAVTTLALAGATAPGAAWSNVNNTYSSPLPTSDLRGNRTNQFTGTFTVANNSARRFSIAIQNSDQQWRGNTTIGPNSLAPEMPGAALMLPALLPMFGMVLRKKGNFRSLLRNNAV